MSPASWDLTNIYWIELAAEENTFGIGANQSDGTYAKHKDPGMHHRMLHDVLPVIIPPGTMKKFTVEGCRRPTGGCSEERKVELSLRKTAGAHPLNAPDFVLIACGLSSEGGQQTTRPRLLSTASHVFQVRHPDTLPRPSAVRGEAL